MRTLTVDRPMGARAFTLSEQNAHYVGRVLRLPEGAPVRVVDSDGAVWSATLSFPNGQATLVDGVPLPSGHGSAPLLLLAALIKGSRWDYTLEKATELGVDVIIPFEARRSVVRIPEAKRAGRRERWQRICDSAIRQCERPGRAIVTESGTLADALAAADKDGAQLIAFNERSPLTPWPAELGGPIGLVIGPEGGFEDDELAALEAAGAHFAGLGPSVVRAETAAAAAVAAVRMIRAGLISG